MAKRRKPWEQLFDTLKVNRDPKNYVRPMDAELDELEAQLGSQLPHTYREFMKRFGPGELKGWVNVTRVTDWKKAPGMSLLRETMEYRRFFATHHPNRRWLATLVYFASSGGGDSYAWDPAAITSRSSHECRFYYLPRHAEHSPVPAGKSFWQFLAWADEHIDSWTGIPDEERTGLEYVPLYPRSKKRPRKPEVKTWLAWNDGTALSLARTIREHGRPDLFPILADALEDAGCDNTDVLTSCRQGDPEIDGVWVLEVLLGKG